MAMHVNLQHLRTDTQGFVDGIQPLEAVFLPVGAVGRTLERLSILARLSRMGLHDLRPAAVRQTVRNRCENPPPPSSLTAEGHDVLEECPKTSGPQRH